MSTPAAESADAVPGRRKYGLELGIGMVDVFVGRDEQRFQVHKHLLCTYAPVFDKMFNGNFKEATEQSAKLPEDECDAVHLFVEWLYSRRLALPSSPENTRVSDPVKLYCFAEKYCLSELMDYAMSYLIHLLGIHWLPGVQHMRYAYEHSAAGSKLRMFMCRALRYIAVEKCRAAGNWSAAELGCLMATNEELTVDFLTSLQGPNGKRPYQNPRLDKPCEYHVHGKTEKCSVPDHAFPSQ